QPDIVYKSDSFRLHPPTRISMSIVRRSLGSLLVLVSLHGLAAAQDPPAQTPPPQSRGVTDKAELQAFLDGMLPALMRDKHVAGATVAVVKDGQIYFSKGYGWQDVDKRIPVDPEKTLFRIGSVTKLFTWNAIM